MPNVVEDFFNGIGIRFFALKIIIWTFCCHSQVYGQDYRTYYKIVDSAEKYAFLEASPVLAIQLYDSAFKKFDFVFAKDCFIASQFAYIYNNKKYEYFLRRGFENGLSISHLKTSKVFRNLVRDTTLFYRSFPDYKMLRKKYLARINVNVLRTVTKMAVQEQKDKLLQTSEFTPILNKYISYIKYVTGVYGFPGEKVIGLLQQDILAELGYHNLDYKDYSGGRAAFDYDNIYVTQSLVYPMLIHSRCPYQKMEEYWNKCIRNGELHPEVVAMFYDNIFNIYRFPKGDKLGEQENELRVFGCGNYYLPNTCYKKNPIVRGILEKYDNSSVDSMRAIIFLNPVKVDSAKKEFGRIHGIRTVFDWGSIIDE